MLRPPRRRELAELPRAKIWDRDEKYDVPVEQVYGKNRILSRADLVGLMILNWSWGTHLASVRQTRVWEATGCPQFDLGASVCRRLLEA